LDCFLALGHNHKNSVKNSQKLHSAFTQSHKISAFKQIYSIQKGIPITTKSLKPKDKKRRKIFKSHLGRCCPEFPFSLHIEKNSVDNNNNLVLIPLVSLVFLGVQHHIAVKNTTNLN
jgi:hypothetical protein